MQSIGHKRLEAAFHELWPIKNTLIASANAPRLLATINVKPFTFTTRELAQAIILLLREHSIAAKINVVLSDCCQSASLSLTTYAGGVRIPSQYAVGDDSHSSRRITLVRRRSADTLTYDIRETP